MENIKHLLNESKLTDSEQAKLYFQIKALIEKEKKVLVSKIIQDINTNGEDCPETLIYYIDKFNANS